MSVNDPVELVWNPKHEHFYLKRGRETFYDDENFMRTWNTAVDAIHWAMTELKIPTIVLPSLDDPWPEE